MPDVGTRIRRNLLRAPFRTVAIDDQRSWKGGVMFLLIQHIAKKIDYIEERTMRVTNYQSDDQDRTSANGGLVLESIRES